MAADGNIHSMLFSLNSTDISQDNITLSDPMTTATSSTFPLRDKFLIGILSGVCVLAVIIITLIITYAHLKRKLYAHDRKSFVSQKVSSYLSSTNLDAAVPTQQFQFLDLNDELRRAPLSSRLSSRVDFPHGFAAMVYDPPPKQVFFVPDFGTKERMTAYRQSKSFKERRTLQSVGRERKWKSEIIKLDHLKHHPSLYAEPERISAFRAYDRISYLSSAFPRSNDATTRQNYHLPSVYRRPSTIDTDMMPINTSVDEEAFSTRSAIFDSIDAIYEASKIPGYFSGMTRTSLRDNGSEIFDTIDSRNVSRNPIMEQEVPARPPALPPTLPPRKVSPLPLPPARSPIVQPPPATSPIAIAIPVPPLTAPPPPPPPPPPPANLRKAPVPHAPPPLSSLPPRYSPPTHSPPPSWSQSQRSIQSRPPAPPPKPTRPKTTGSKISQSAPNSRRKIHNRENALTTNC